MNRKLQHLQKITAWILPIYAVMYYAALLLFPSAKIMISDVFSVLGELIALAVIAKSLSHQEKIHRLTWFITGAGVFFYMLGDVIWSIVELGFRREVPFPSVCDVFYLLSALTFVIGFFSYIRKQNTFLFMRTGFDVLIAMVVGATLIWKFELLPISADTTISTLEKLVSISYPILDLAFLGGILSLFFFFPLKIRLEKRNLLLCIAFLMMAVADQIYLTNVFQSYISGGLIDPLWPISILIIALASLYPNQQTNETHLLFPQPKEGTEIVPLNYLRLLLPYVGTSLLVFLASYEYLTKDPLIVGIILSGLLIMIRQVFTLLENQRLLALVQQTNRSLEESKKALEIQNTELKRLSQLSEHEAATDFLTGLFNRRYIYRILRSYAKQPGEDTDELAVLLIDVDYFKNINDTFGHEQGDIALRRVAHIIRANVRPNDTAGRFGGDEFIVIMPDADIDYIEMTAKTMVEKISELDLIDPAHSVSITASIGCTQWKGAVSDCDINRLIASADKALYAAKSGGRNCVHLTTI